MTVSRPCYVNRNMVKRALDVKMTARSDPEVDRAIETASDQIDGGALGGNAGGGLLHRRLYPETRTRYLDWPPSQPSAPWRLWLGQHTLISVTSMTAGGVTITSSQYLLLPYDGPPYRYVEIDTSTSAALQAGDTSQRAIAIAGVWGWTATTEPAGQLAEALDASETGVDVSDSSLLGVGDLIVVDSERMLITGQSMRDTGVNIDAADSLTASNGDVAITMSTTTGAPTVGETILIDSERMLVVDIAGSVLTVKRAYDGSTLAAHSANADIYALRTLTVARAATGSTAAAHSDATSIGRQLYPPLVRDLGLGYALNQLLQENSGYARVAGSGDNAREFTGRGIKQLEADAVTAYGRMARKAAI